MTSDIPAITTPPGSRSLSLYRRIVTLIAVIFLLLALIITTGIYLFVNQHEESFQRQRQTDAVRSAAALINGYLETNEMLLATLGNFGIDELQSNPTDAQVFFNSNPTFMEVTLVDGSGKTLFGAARGRPVLGSQFTVRQSQWFRTAKSGEKYYSDVQTSPSDESYIILALPAGEGQVVAAQLKMDGLWQKVAAISFGRSGTVYVANRLGRIVAHRDSRLVTSNRNIGGRPEFGAMIAADGNQYAGIGFGSSRAAMVSSLIPATGWIIIAELPLDEAMEMRHRALFAIPIGLFALFALTALIFRHLLWKTVLQRLNALCHGARHLSHGNLSFRHQLPEQRDELSQVMEVFNSMAGDLERRQQEQESHAAQLAEACQRSERELAERKRVEAKLTQLNEQLERRVAERTATLEQLNANLTREMAERAVLEEKRQKLESQLQQSQKMEAIGTLAGGIAHDFNNILGAIIGYGEMLCDDLPSNTTAHNDIEQILAAGQRAKELVKQILAFSRQATSDKIPIQPATIVKESLKLLRSSIPTTIAMRNDISNDCGVILADPTQVQQIVINLCTNAYHAMENSGGTMLVSLKRRELSAEDFQEENDQTPGPYVVLAVRDSGTGITPEVRERMFDPYFTTKEIGKGTGMGLAVIHGIVKSHGGFIRCRSVVGEGSTFEVFFPAAEVQATRIEDIHDSIPGGSEHLLLVDDEQVLLDMNAGMLQRLGYRVTAKSNSFEALAAFTANPRGFDMVLSDQTMPGLTGEQLAGQILALRPDIPFLLCTGYSAQISEEKISALGIRGLAMKPLAKRDVANLIRQALDQPPPTSTNP